MIALLQTSVIVVTALVGAVLTAATTQPPTRGECYRLAAYLSYLIATDIPDGGGGGSSYSAGDTCPECGGKGEVGDGKVMVTCNFRTDDDKLMCKGGTLREVGDVAEVEDEIVDYGIGEEIDLEIKASPLKMPGSRWNVEGRWNYDWDFIANHLRTVHGFNDVEGYSIEELEIIHNNIHEGWPPFGCVKAASSGSSSSNCPSGNCPTSSSGSFTRRRGLFRR